MTQSTVTMPLSEFLRLKETIEEYQKVIRDHLSKGEEIIIESYYSHYFNQPTYTVLEASEQTKVIAKANRESMHYKHTLNMVLNKKLPTFINPSARTVRDLFKHDEKIKNI